MTKKHYEAIARIMHYDTQGDTKAENARVNTAQLLASYFATDNPRFDRERFLQACGIEQSQT